MKQLFDKVKLSIKHLEVLHKVFENKKNYNLPEEKDDFEIYFENTNSLLKTFNELKLFDSIYNQKDRQMILADLFEYILLGRGFYSIGTKRNNNLNKGKFIKGILHFVNLLMCYESITINVERRNLFIDKLSKIIPIIKKEKFYKELRTFKDNIGLPESDASKELKNYFDKLLPKTAGGLWHELLVYIFLLRNNYGFILPLLLHQKLYSKTDHIVPPDFLLLTRDKRIYGIEVGIKKEIQSGAFSIKTAIPTATIDTINSRNSDRCPICRKWINFCPFVIDNYSNLDYIIERIEVKCLDNCTIFSKEEIANGICKFSKYSRGQTKTLKYTHHKLSYDKHYHYKSFLNHVTVKMKNTIIQANDNTAIKTHYPYYSGLEELIRN